MIESRFLNMLSLRYVVPLISLAWVLGPFAGCSIDSSVRPLQTESLLNQLPPAFWVSSNPIIDVPKVELQREQTPARVSERQQNLHDSHDENGKEAADHDGKIASIRMLEKQPGSVSAGSSKHHLPNANHVAGERSHQISTRFLDPELTADPPQAEPAPPEVVETPTTTFFPAGRSTLEMVAEPIQDNPIPDDNVEELKGTSPEAQMDTQSHNELKLAETTPADKDQPAETSGHTAHPSDAKYRLHGQAAWRPLAVPDNPPQADDSGPPPFTLNIVETPRQNDTAPDNSEEIEGNTLTIRSNPTSSENIATQTPKVQIASPLEPNSSPPYRLVIVHPENRPDETTRMNTDNGNGSDESLKASTNTHFTTAEGATTSSGDQSNGGQQDDPVADPEIVAPSNRPSYTIHFAESPLLSEFWDDRVLEFPSADANVTLHGNPHPASGQVRFVERQVIANYHKEDTKSIRADLKPLASYPPAHAIDLHDKIHCLNLLPVHPSKRGIRPAKTGQQGNVSRSEDAQRASKNSVPSSNIQSPDPPTSTSVQDETYLHDSAKFRARLWAGPPRPAVQAPKQNMSEDVRRIDDFQPAPRNLDTYSQHLRTNPPASFWVEVDRMQRAHYESGRRAGTENADQIRNEDKEHRIRHVSEEQFQQPSTRLPISKSIGKPMRNF